MGGGRAFVGLALAAASLLVACDAARLFQRENTLEGGPYLILEMDVDALRGRQLENVADLMVEALRSADPSIRYSGRGVLGDAARIRLAELGDLGRARRALSELARAPDSGAQILVFTEGADGLIEARLTPSHLGNLSRQAADQSVEIIRRRVDPTGFDHFSIERQGDLRIRVQAPRGTDTELLRRQIGVTGLLTFHLVREVSPEQAAEGRIPSGSMLVQPYPGIGSTPEVVDRRPRFTGERLARASPSTDSQTGEFVLSFQLDAEGARLFCRITRERKGERFAVLLDNRVLTAPRINEPICGGSGQISGNFTAQSANELAIMLRAGALPTPLSVVEEGVNASD